MVHKTTILGLFFSFSSLSRQISNDSHFASGVTGFLQFLFVPIIRVSVSTLSSFCSSIILITWATEAPPKEITAVYPTTRISFRSLNMLSPLFRCWLPVGTGWWIVAGFQVIPFRHALGCSAATCTKFFRVLRSFRMSITRDLNLAPLPPALWDLLFLLSWWLTGLHAEKKRSYPSFCPLLGVSPAS